MINSVNKKNYIILLFITFILLYNIGLCWANSENLTSSEAVTQVVLLELFVQADCSTCPHVEFCLEDLSWEYGTEKIILLEEHLWHDGYDTEETNARYDWYVTDGRKGTPDLFVNGLTKRVQGLLCEDLEENYHCCKEIVDSELNKCATLKLSALKTITDSYITIQGKVNNISNNVLKNLAICGMIYREEDEAGLNYWVRDIFPFHDLPIQFSPHESIEYGFVSEPLISEENEEIFHAVVFVQDLETKEVLQALHID